MNTKEIGGEGELIARQTLTAAGYAIVDTNVIIGNVEVDVIAQNHNRMIFVEVKTRKADAEDWRYGIDDAKIRRLSRAGANYVRSKNLPHEVQIDAILVTNYPDSTYSVDHIPDITMPPIRRRR